MAKTSKDKLKKLKAKAKKLKRRLKAVEAKLSAPKGPLVSPLAPPFPELPAIEGVTFATMAVGVKYQNRTDVMLATCAPGTTMAGVFTKSATCSAAVSDCQKKLADQKGKDGWAIVVNSGNANAFTGIAGEASVAKIAKAAGNAIGIPASRVLTSSTGVIGQPLPHDRITKGLEVLTDQLHPDGMAAAAQAIMTTDTFPKACVRTVELDGETVTIAGIAKGSGMIAPDMATMLAYVFTDARIAQPLLQSMLSGGADQSFNAITVDSDTSTSDTVLLAATGKAGPEMSSANASAYRTFRLVLEEVLRDLALQIVRDGEGATKLIEVQVTGADHAGDARRVAGAIANSPLIKTAVAGEDANWGRVVMAVGKAGAKADRDRLAIRFGELQVAQNGQVVEGYSEADASAYMKGDHIVIGVDLGLGEGQATMWGCDLTYRYVEINADYRS